MCVEILAAGPASMAVVAKTVTDGGLIGVEIHGEDGVFIKQMVLPAAGITVPQHAHTYAHTSMLAVGSVRVWKDGVLMGDFHAPTGITIEAKVKHTFLSLEPSIIYCIHNVGRDGSVSVHEHHELEN